MRFSLTLIVAFLFIFALAGAALAQEVEVQPGDTLSKIANEHSTTWQTIYETNSHKIDDPHWIFPGQVFSLTGSSSNSESSSSSTSESSNTSSSSPSSSSSTSSGGWSVDWNAIAECESNQTWNINTGNGYYGGLQFNKSSWDWAVEVGGHSVPEWPHNASKSQQIAVAETLLSIHPAGIGAWPACADMLGLR